MPQIYKNCLLCGSLYSGPAWHMRRRTYCGATCYHAARDGIKVGDKFGFWTVVGSSPNQKRKSCKCACGAIREVTSQNLKTGKSKSCGCQTIALKVAKQTKHGACGTAAYRRWDSMLQRCNNNKNEHYRNYGARGIKVCDRWHNFANFLEDMGQPPKGGSLERVNNDAGYSKENCIWTDRKTQQRNRRVCRFITHNGKTQCLTAWCEELGLVVATVYYRMKAGKTELQALGLSL